MAIITEKFLICDGGCGNTFGVDNRQKTGAQHREEAIESGWVCDAAIDICPNCQFDTNPKKEERELLTESKDDSKN